MGSEMGSENRQKSRQKQLTDKTERWRQHRPYVVCRLAANKERSIQGKKRRPNKEDEVLDAAESKVV